jgi:hypothetical protein
MGLEQMAACVVVYAYVYVYAACCHAQYTVLLSSYVCWRVLSWL